MPRPRSNRKIKHMLGVTYFKPQGIPISILEQVDLGLDDGDIKANDRVLIDDEIITFSVDANKDLGFSCQKNVLGNRYAIEFSINIDNNEEGEESDPTKIEIYKTYAVIRNEI